MIQMQSQLLAADNSGARYVQCIKTLKGFNRKTSYCGDIIKVSVKKLKLIRKVKKGQMYLALIARTKKAIIKKDGLKTKFGINAAILLTNKKKILGTRIFGAISHALRQKRFLKFLLLSGYKVY
jgi:large subunit ribosomal protein L14